MTLIMGAKCKDGVVLVGDRKVSAELSDSYTDKIRFCGNLNWAIFGAAGVETLFEDFLAMLPQKIEYHANWVQYQNQRILNQHTQEFKTNSDSSPPLMIYGAEDFKQDCVELLTEMRNRYSVAFEDPSCTLEVLVGFAVQNDRSKLYYLNSTYCLPAEVNSIVSIGQSELAEIFRKSWNDNMTMEQTAKLGMLAIKYIEQEGISKGIGVGNFDPQVWYIPNYRLPHEVKDVELSFLLADAERQFERLRMVFHSLFGN